jgi:hypothetical protein
MIVGIGFIGVFTATITSFFFDQGRATAVELLDARLSRIEEKLDALQRRSVESQVGDRPAELIYRSEE